MGYRFWGLGHPQNTWSQDDSLGELFDPHREFQYEFFTAGVTKYIPY